MKARFVYENMDFERGKDPKTVLSIGLKARRDFDTIQEAIEWMFRFPDVFSEGRIKEWDFKIKKTENSYGNFVEFPQIRENRIQYVRWVKWNLKTKTIDGELWGLKKSKDALDGLERFLIDRTQKMYESLEFERGQDPISAMKIGARKLLKSDSLGPRTGWTLLEKMRLSDLLGEDPYDVYILGFAGEIGYSEWHFNKFTEMLAKACVRGKVLDKKKYGDNVYVLIDTKFGNIVRAQMDEEGLYFYGGLDAALNIGIQDIPQGERESIY
jgi:hypothetical protein